MKNFSIIAAIDKNNGIGKKNGLPWYLKKDMRHFAEITTGDGQNAVIMGSNTWRSLPEKYRPLPRRLNIVLSFEKMTDLPEGVLNFQSLEEALADLKQKNIQEIFVIGGGQIFAAAINHPNCAKLYLTEVAADFDCDIFFPPIPPIFQKTASQKDEDNGYQLVFAIYEKIA
ncbi:MAG: dihydrofolate reductase [bacterium]|nr:dihydrofolate reductase [bacterium]